MKKRFLRFMTLTLCLCMLFSISAAAATGELVDVSGGTDGGVSQVDGGGETPTPEPEKDAKYTITIAAPRGWYTKTATVTVKLEDVNLTGFEKADAKLGANGSWQDISDGLRAYGWAHVEISDNATVYVTVTDKKGKAHVKSLYIECFDREAPTVRAKIEGRMLRVDTDDNLSGVEYVYVNGYRFDDLTNGTLDIRVKDYVDEDEQEIYVQAVDCAGNKSKTAQVKNPYYNPPSSSKAETSQASSAAPASSTAPTSQAPAASAPAAAAAQPAVSAPAAQSAPAQTVQPAASETSDTGSVTPTDGTGTVIENSVKAPEQREFFTITTEAGNDFYIVVDKEKSDKNVYLLSEVTEDDLTGLAKPSEKPATTEIPRAEPEPEIKPAPEPEPAPETEPEPEAQPEPASTTGATVTIIVIALGIGAAGWYFKIYKPKKDNYNEEWDGEDAEDDNITYEDEAQQPVPEKEDENEQE